MNEALRDERGRNWMEAAYRNWMEAAYKRRYRTNERSIKSASLREREEVRKRRNAHLRDLRERRLAQPKEANRRSSYFPYDIVEFV